MKRFLKLSAMFAAAAFIASACEDLPLNPNPDPDGSATKVSIETSISNYTKATDTEFESGDAISLSIVTPTSVYLDNCKFTYRQGAWVAENEANWYSDNVPSMVVAWYPSVSGSLADYYPLGSSPLEFTVQSDQTTHSGYTGSDLMLAVKENVYPSQDAVELVFQHLLSKVVINVKNQTEMRISDVYLSGVYGKVSVSDAYNLDGGKASIKAAAYANPNSGYTHSFQVIVPPQTAQPLLIVATDDGMSYEYELPEEVVFSSGKVRTAEIVITSGSISAEFNSDILNWTSDPDLNFTQPEEPEWTSLGYGGFVESFLAPFGVDVEEWPVEYEQNINTPELYRLKNPYTNEYSPYNNLATSDEDSYIYFTVLEGGKVYVLDGPIGITVGNYGELYGGSLCSENGWEQENYGSLREYDNYKYIQFQPGAFYLGLTLSGEFAYFYGLEHPYCVFTFPGYEREELMNLRNGIQVSDDENENKTTFQMETGPDMPANSLMFAIYEGAHTSSECLEIAGSMVSDSSNPLSNPAGNNVLTLSVSLQTGTYTAVAAYKSIRTEGVFYYYYQIFSHLVPGEEAPEVTISNIEITPDPDAPEYCADVKFLAPGASRIGSLLLSDSALQEIGEDEAARLDYLKANGKFTSGYALVSKEYYTRCETELQPGTHYNYLVYVENLFGNCDFASSEFTTAPEDNSKWVERPQKGEYFDNLWQIGYQFDPFFAIDPVEVTIMQYDGASRYKVIAPYAEYWNGRSGGEVYNSLPDSDKDIEFWIKNFDHCGDQSQGIYFRPFTTGGSYSTSDFPPYLMPYAYISHISHHNGCNLYTDETFHLSGWLEVFGGRTPHMGYSFYGANDYFVVSLTPGAYTSPYATQGAAQTAARTAAQGAACTAAHGAAQLATPACSSWGSPLKLEDYLEGTYLQTRKSYFPTALQIRESCSPTDLRIRESCSPTAL